MSNPEAIGLKQINDTLGHRVGDLALETSENDAVEIAERRNGTLQSSVDRE